MDDSDQDFADLCSKLLKRVRKKPCETKQPRKAERQLSSQSSEGDKRRVNNKKDGESGSKVTRTQSVCTETSQHAVNVGTGRDSGDAGSLAVSSAATESPRAEKVMTAKDKVLIRMQQFKRASPPRMAHRGKRQPANNEDDSGPDLQPQGQDHPEPYSSHHPSESDEALALRLQQELDREAAETEAVDLEDGGLFFCQICQRDLSHMTPDGRMQHINRCLDESEERVQAPLPPLAPPGVPDCPICGKRFKSLKSRSAHLKRCSSDMGVSPAVLLQAVQRQAEETQNVLAANMITQTGGTKRKGPTKSALPVGKKPRKKTDPLDEDTMVALALSSSLLEQEKGAERELQTKITASHISMTPALKKKPDAGKGRGKKKKGAITRPPPLLLIQDAQAALVRLEERVSALLLRSRAPSPPTPTLSPSRLRGWNGAAPLWQKSALLDSYCASDFYTPELSEFITPWESAKTVAPSSDVCNKLESSRQLVNEETPVMGTRASIVSSSSQNAASSPAASTPGTGRLPVGSQALCDLMELAEDGMTLTQCGYAASDGNKNRQSSASLSTNLHVSGFVLEEAEQQDDLCSSGFLPETVQTPSEDVNRQSSRKSQQLREDKGGSSHRSAALSRLSSDLSSMVNNPQLSDVQLQVDSGDVYFAHSFMVYARCPLLAEMVHESGFGVREEGMSAAQRVLLSDVPGQAVLTLLQYLYTAHCSIPASLQPHVLELASRFDLKELQQLCHLHPEEAAALGEEADDMNQDANVSDRTDLAFMELLRSMWNEEDEDVDTDEGQKDDGGFEERHQVDDVTSSEREICEEQVNEQELEEIYQFAATQRKKEEEKEDEEKDSMEEEEEEKVDDGEEVFTKLTEPKRGSGEKTTKPDPKLDLSYSRLFSDSWGVYEEKDLSSSPSTSSSPKIHTPQSQKYQTPRKPQHTLSGRTLLQSSPSIVDGISPSASPITSNLPIAGLSPGQDSDWGGGGGGDKVKTNMVKKCLPLKRESHGPRSICAPVSPDLFSKKKKEPELIVLSDSSEEMEADVAVLSPSPLSPCNVQNQKSCTQIKPQTILKPTEPVMDNKVSSSLELNTSDPAAASARSCPGSSRDQIPVDCSLEVSWLIPSTPVQPGPNTRTNSTQTKTSMCRTRLFPKGDTSSASSLLSSPALPLNSKHQTPSCVSVHSGPTEGSVSRLKLDEAPCSSSFNVKFSPDTSNNSMLSAGFPHQPKVSNLSSAMHRHPLQTSFKNDTPLHIQHQPHSSTPLHTDHYQPPDPLTTSPLHSSLSKQKSTSQKRNSAPSENPEKRQLMSFHLSPLSDPSDPPTSPCHRSLKSSQKHRKSSSESPCSVASSSRKNTGSELKSMIRNKEDEREIECENNDMGNEVVQEKAEENGEAEVADSSFQHSFMDEPPIAFNDSWGFDANPGCFSLRLEDSRGSNQQERGETARSSPPSDCRPPPSTHWVQSPKSCERVINSSSSEAHSTSPSTSRQAQIRASLTPSPPEQNSLLDSKIWDSWREEDEEVLPLSQRVNPSAHLKTPASSRLKKRCSLVPITPMPHYSDMDTPELKNKLNRFGVRPLPKRQMILKLKEIHQYTHQLVSSDSEDEATSARQTARTRPPAPASSSASSRPVSSSTQRVTFKEPSVPTAASPLKQKGEEEGELLSASQGSNTSSTAASEESERSNPELCVSSDDDSDSDGGISASQAATRLQDRLQAVRSFILTDSRLYSQILQYQPLVLSQLQQRLKTAGIRLGAAKLVDYLDSQCITFTTAKPGHSARSRRQGKKTGKVAKTVGERGAKRKKVVTAML